MKSRHLALRAFTALVGAVILGLAAAPAGAATPAQQDFYADSGETCPLGYTKGVLDSAVTTTPLPAVLVDGDLVDSGLCGVDARYTVATVTAYAGKAAVDTEAVRVDDGTLTFRFLLTGRAIDVVTVQVCRISLLPGPFDYCGKTQEYPI